MSASNEWWDFHLTPQGWVDGSYKEDFGGTKEVDPPPDRVLTMRYKEYQSSPFSRCTTSWEERWRSADEPTVQSLLAQYGKKGG